MMSISAGGDELGVRDGDGVGGGKGWSNGEPYSRCKLNGGGWREVAGGVAEWIGGLIREDDKGAIINEEGFTRLVTRFLLLIESEES